MPHVLVKLVPGRSEDQKTRLADAIAHDIVTILGINEAAVSFAVEEVSKEDWAEKVYRPEILEKSGTLYKKPGYNPFEKQGTP
jgi:4-oxalocrotonate tautomerase